MESELWLVTLPCPVGADGNSFMQKLQDTMRNNKLGEFLPFEMPVLSVGTLDILMGLSDDLVKIVGQVESTLKKVERQYYDIAGQTSEKLKVDDVPVPVFYKNFQWDLARYRYGSVPLADIVGNITSMVGGVDMELKRLNTSLSEKIQALTALQRKKVINLNTSDFEDFLSDDDMNKAEVVNSDFLLTVGLIVSAANEKEFLETYDRLGEDIACFGGPEWAHNMKGVGLNDGNYGPASGRGTVRGSPVIPQSAKLVKTHGEHKLYAVTILKGHYEAGVFVDGAFTDGKFVDYLPRLKEAMRSKRITLR